MRLRVCVSRAVQVAATAFPITVHGTLDDGLEDGQVASSSARRDSVTRKSRDENGGGASRDNIGRLATR
jgi:hypothetical protein